MVSWAGLANGNEIKEFYFKDNKLLFVYEQFNSFVFYETKQILRPDSTERTFEGRCYFNDEKLIDQISTGHNRFEDDRNDAQALLLKEAAEDRKMLTRKKSRRR